MGDAGLHFAVDHVEDRHARRFAAGAGGRGDGDERLERAGNRFPASDRRIDVIEKVGRIRRIQIGGLGRVDRAPAPDGDEGFDFFGDGELRRRLKTGVGRLDADLVVQHEVDVAGAAIRRRRRPSADRRGPGRSPASRGGPPASARSIPTSRVIPRPKRIFDTAS